MIQQFCTCPCKLRAVRISDSPLNIERTSIRKCSAHWERYVPKGDLAVSMFNLSAQKLLPLSNWRRRWDSNPRDLSAYLISSQARYDHFDTPPCAILKYMIIMLLSRKKETRECICTSRLLLAQLFLLALITLSLENSSRSFSSRASVIRAIVFS